MSELTSKSKSFWGKPEGTTGMIFLVGIIIAIAVLLGPTLLPWIIALLSNTLHAIILIGVIGAIVALFLNKRFRTLIGYIFKSIMRFITKLFVEIDPIGIIENYVDDLKDNLRKMNKQISNLKGQMYKLKEVIKKNQKEMSNNLKLASKAKETGKASIMMLKSRKAGRLKESNMTLQALYNKMEVLYRVLSKMYENSAILLEDIVDEVDVRKREREAIHAGHSAFKSAMSIIDGDGDKRVLFDMAMDAIADDVGKKVGEMERFMEISQNFMESIDLQNGVFEEEGMKLLEQWENEGASLLLGSEKQYIIEVANNEAEVLDLDNSNLPTKVQKSNQYDKLFDF